MLYRAVGFVVLAGLSWACGDDSGETEADRLGVGAQCASDDDCDVARDGEIQQHCLDGFKGGYCGIADCEGDDDCPENSACVAHEDGVNYCFRTCVDKQECNRHRDADNESNCSSNIEYVNAERGNKACVPPSGE